MVRSTLIATLLFCASFGVAGCGSCGSSDQVPPASGPGAPPRLPLPSVAASGEGPGVAATTTETTGTTFPIERAEVAPNMSGVIAAIPVTEGSRVARGDLLFRLRAEELSLRVEQARAAQRSAEVQLAAARVENERAQRLLEKSAIDRAQAERVAAQHDAAQAAVEQARVAVSLARRYLADATVRSPISGVVTAVLKNEGEIASMMPPTVVVVVENHATLELRFRLPELAISRVDVGDTIEATFAAVGVTRRAQVARVGPSVDPRTRTVEVMALLDNGDGALRAGMLARVDLRGDGRAGEVAAPEEPAP